MTSDMTRDKASPISIYFDGQVVRQRAVTLDFGAALDIFEDGQFLVAWSFGDIRRLPSQPGVMRLRAVSAPKHAWLYIANPDLQQQALAHCKLLGGEKAPDPAPQRRRVAYGALALAMTGAFLYGGIPRMAGAIAPFVPVEWEKSLGDAIDDDVRGMFPGKACTQAKGAAALKKLSQGLQDASHLRIPATMAAIDSTTPNAFALPGGKVYLLKGLLDKAQSQDEVIGVLAHELGHLEHRDHLRRMIATGGTALIVALIAGDISGGLVASLGNSMLSAAHSREAEAQADDFAAKTMAGLGRPSKPMGELLMRITGAEKDGSLLSILRDHPVSEDRLAKLAAADRGVKSSPLLTDAEWEALKGICG